MYFETHAHYTSDAYIDDREEVIEMMQKSKVSYIVNIASDLKSNTEAICLSKKYDFMYSTIGIHPIYSADVKKEDIEIIRSLASSPKVVAFGEIGLDYHHTNSPREVQKWWFDAQLDLEKELKLPIIIHCRDAHEPTFETLKKADMPIHGDRGFVGISHCFSGSVQMSKMYVDMGYLIGIGGVITFKNAKKLVEVVEQIPLEYLVIETDAPYLSPVPHRGQRNDSSKLEFVVETIAQIKGISHEYVADTTLSTAKRFFGIV